MSRMQEWRKDNFVGLSRPNRSSRTLRAAGGGKTNIVKPCHPPPTPTTVTQPVSALAPPTRELRRLERGRCGCLRLPFIRSRHFPLDGDNDFGGHGDSPSMRPSHWRTDGETESMTRVRGDEGGVDWEQVREDIVNGGVSWGDRTSELPLSTPLSKLAPCSSTKVHCAPTCDCCYT